MPDPNVRAYLLGRLPPAEAEALEDRYVDDDGLRASIEREEEALIEAFVDGRLDEASREAFERVLAASPDRRRRVEVVRGLVVRATPGPSVAPVVVSRVSWSGVAWGLAAAAVVVLAVWTPWRRSPVVAPSPATPAASAVVPPPTPPRRDAPAVPVLALTLSVSGTRGSGAPSRIDLPPDTALDLSLVRRGAHWAGRAITVRDVDRGTQWRGRLAAPPKGVADIAGMVRVPAGALPKGDYVVAVGGVPDARYTLFVR